MTEKIDIADLKSGYMSLESIDQSKNAPQDIKIELRVLDIDKKRPSKRREK